MLFTMLTQGGLKVDLIRLQHFEDLSVQCSLTCSHNNKTEHNPIIARLKASANYQFMVLDIKSDASRL